MWALNSPEDFEEMFLPLSISVYSPDEISLHSKFLSLWFDIVN